MSRSGNATALAYEYVGSELDLFAHAVNWKRYFASKIASDIRGDVLEVGAGIGETTRYLCDGRQRSWVCLEPDSGLANRLTASFDARALIPPPRVKVGTLADVDDDIRFDTILYIDVLEHIDDDREELRRASALLRNGGAIIVLSPAFQWLFSEFDRSLGHYRRYTRRSLAAVFPATLRRRRLFYLDSIGFMASAANRVMLHQSAATAGQVRVWDRVLIPASRVVDQALGRAFGRSVIAIYERP
jgi:SAM-dependent methyltransferase